MTDSHDEIHGTAKTRQWIYDEIKKQMEPQTRLIAMMVARLDRMEVWSKKLWGNGSGPPGYLENARAEDKAWKEEMQSTISQLQADAIKEEGKEELRREIELNRREIEHIADEKKTHRWTRAQVIVTMLCSFAGTWLLSLIRPFFHTLLVKFLQ